MAEITNLRQIIQFFRDDDDTHMAWSRWLGRGAARMGMHGEVTLMELCNVLSLPIKAEWGTAQCFLGFIHEMPPLDLYISTNKKAPDTLGALHSSFSEWPWRPRK